MGAVCGQGLPREARLRRRSEYRRAEAAGARVHTPHFVVVAAKGPDGARRLGITASTKVGTAVVRNRVKRVVREVFRRHRDEFPERSWVVIIAKRVAGEVGLRTAEQELLGACLRLRRGRGC